jgi:curved DNA-binding protein CbpA
MAKLAPHYRTLELPKDADYKQAKQQKNDLLQVWHPDKHQKNERMRKKAEKKTREINDAWQEVEKYFTWKKQTNGSDSRTGTSREKSDPRNGRTRTDAGSGKRTHTARNSGQGWDKENDHGEGAGSAKSSAGDKQGRGAGGQQNLRKKKVLLKVLASVAALIVVIIVSTNASWSTKESWKCRFGDAGACWRLGWAYSIGFDVEKDLPRAAELYEQACAGGDVRGCNDLGLM